jgi:hypothetical protein
MILSIPFNFKIMEESHVIFGIHNSVEALRQKDITNDIELIIEI